MLADMTDLGQVTSLMAGHDAVVHMAAIPSPVAHPPEFVFHLNVMSTFNILQAATMLGIKKVVMASSVSAMGYAYRFLDFSPLYFPVDEDHPLLSQDAYGLSKTVGEEIADGFARRTPDMSLVSLRFTWVFVPGQVTPERIKQPSQPGGGLWTYIDVRDAARACRLSLQYDMTGHEAFHIASHDTYAPEPSRELIETYFPDAEVRGEFNGHEGLFDCSRAAEKLGFVPEYGIE